MVPIYYCYHEDLEGPLAWAVYIQRSQHSIGVISNNLGYNRMSPHNVPIFLGRSCLGIGKAVSFHASCILLWEKCSFATLIAEDYRVVLYERIHIFATWPSCLATNATCCSKLHMQLVNTLLVRCLFTVICMKSVSLCKKVAVGLVTVIVWNFTLYCVTPCTF